MRVERRGAGRWRSKDARKGQISARLPRKGLPTPTRPDNDTGGRGRDHHCDLTCLNATPDVVNHRLESRVRENRTHGSEGGGPYGLPTPIRRELRPVGRGGTADRAHL